MSYRNSVRPTDKHLHVMRALLVLGGRSNYIDTHTLKGYANARYCSFNINNILKSLHYWGFIAKQPVFLNESDFNVRCHVKREWNANDRNLRCWRILKRGADYLRSVYIDQEAWMLISNEEADRKASEIVNGWSK